MPQQLRILQKTFLRAERDPLGQRATRMKCFTRVHVGQLLRLLLHDTLKKKTKLQNYIVQSERRIKVASRLTLQQFSRSIIHNEQIY